MRESIRPLIHTQKDESGNASLFGICHPKSSNVPFKSSFQCWAHTPPNPCWEELPWNYKQLWNATTQSPSLPTTATTTKEVEHSLITIQNHIWGKRFIPLKKWEGTTVIHSTVVRRTRLVPGVCESGYEKVPRHNTWDFYQENSWRKIHVM